MKFLILALFVAAANASAIWPYAAWHAPVSGPIAQISSHSWPHAAVIAHPAPIAYAAHSYAHAWDHAHVHAAPVVVAPAHLPAHAATYKAQTLGATHVAPLPGHTIDRANLNLAAPPTH